MITIYIAPGQSRDDCRVSEIRQGGGEGGGGGWDNACTRASLPTRTALSIYKSHERLCSSLSASIRTGFLWVLLEFLYVKFWLSFGIILY